jgi:sugar lactone lactonase YvrE
MTNKNRKWLLLGGLILLGIVAALLVLILGVGNPIDGIIVRDAGLYPEGIDYDAAGERFLISSMSRGTVTEVFEDGTFNLFIDDEEMISTAGIHIDTAGGRILVAGSDPGVGESTSEATLNATAVLGIYDLETGDRLHLVDVGALLPESEHFANDVAVDADGNAYVTDSFAAAIYRVDVDGNAAIFLQDETFGGEGFGLNGIDYHPDGYLLAVTLNTGLLVKISPDSPEDFSLVELETPLLGADGINLTADGDLVVNDGWFAGEGPPKVVILSSDDNWESAAISATVETRYNVTTAALRDDEVHVIFGHTGELFDGNRSYRTFEIVQIDFDDAE